MCRLLTLDRISTDRYQNFINEQRIKYESKSDDNPSGLSTLKL